MGGEVMLWCVMVLAFDTQAVEHQYRSGHGGHSLNQTPGTLHISNKATNPRRNGEVKVPVITRTLKASSQSNIIISHSNTKILIHLITVLVFYNHIQLNNEADNRAVH